MYKHHLHKSELKQKLMQEQNSGFLWKPQTSLVYYQICEIEFAL